MKAFEFIHAVPSVFIIFMSCTGNNLATSARSLGGTSFKLERAYPLAAKPGQIVTIVGSAFDTLKTYNISSPGADSKTITAAVTVADQSTASFPLPNGLGTGVKTLSLADGSTAIATLKLITTLADSNVAVYTGNASDICTTVSFYDSDGALKQGTKNCSDVSSGSACTSNGQQSCIVSGSYYAAAACAANGSNCYVPTYAASTQPLKAADLTNLTAGNIKDGVTIAGQAGNYPSSTYPLSGASGTADLSTSTFNTQMASATAFEYWDSTGTRQTGAGDADLTTANVTSGTNIFGVTGVAASGSFDAQVSSGIHRTVATTQMTLATEKSTSSYAAGYREIPDIFKDDTAFWNTTAGCTAAGGANQTCSSAVWATRPTTICGTTQNTITARIAHCLAQNSSSATWNGQTNGIAAEATWKLVTYTGTYEVWRDERTGLVWSDKVPTNDNWCKATGNYQSDDPSAFCNNATYQDQTTPYSYCVETASHQPSLAGENWTTGAYHGIKGGMGAVSTATSPSVRWRLPSRVDWLQADIDGIRQVLPNINTTLWTATIYDSLRQRANYFIGSSGTIAASSTLGTVNRNAASGIICVGR